MLSQRLMKTRMLSSLILTSAIIALLCLFCFNHHDMYKYVILYTIPMIRLIIAKSVGHCPTMAWDIQKV